MSNEDNTNQQAGPAIADDDDERAGYHFKVLDDGDIEFTFVGENGDVTGRIHPSQFSQIVGSFLKIAHGAFSLSEKNPDDVDINKPFEIVPITGLRFARHRNHGVPILVVQIGETLVGFQISLQDFRRIGRGLLRGSYRSLTSLALFRTVWSDFWFDLRGWAAVFSARLVASSRRRATSFSSRISGRSLRVFRAIEVTPGADLPDYNPVRKCIYCDAEVYSTKPGVRRQPLGAEHIIAEGLDGKLELPEASCQECEDITGRVVEGDVLLRTLKAVRMHFQIRGKRGSSRPSTLPLTTTKNDIDTIIQVPIEDYPVLFNMPVYGVPGVFVDNPNPITTGFTMVALNHDWRVLRKKYGISTFSAPVWDTYMLFRMLGKIGHALAVAELGINGFKPALRDMILTGAPDAFNHIGGEPLQSPPSKALHELALGYQRARGKDYVVAKIRLFANRPSSPTYYVVAGEATESAVAKFKRVLSSKISRTPVR
jgi:hypothetical protein